ncbi:prepilin-type N-terminal cleavage/methylation domain-containing protein [Sulfuricurvum sp.]|uniref:pilus assembly FimT family protein n=1 Tax=Sulfuricurvum sp. TaxID=2025608 RepID=UPI0025D932FA|nr:prepilin-type N-terminal cleavage/methylation domain-containing protein [Sulfuricurvum sp.]
MKRFAFTLLELVFVIIVIGILAVLAMPDFKSNQLQQAAEQVANHIRYTQHLAMIDDKFDPTDATWFQDKWAIDLCQPAYLISTLNGTMTATDPLTTTDINGTAVDDFNLATKFGITGVTVTGGNCRIGFDNLGRPYGFTAAGLPATTFAGLLNANTIITLQHTDGNATITVRPETGYVSVTYN